MGLFLTGLYYKYYNNFLNFGVLLNVYNDIFPI